MGCTSSYDNSNYVRTITFVGLEGSGKSNIVFHFVAASSANFVPLPTAGVEFHEFELGTSKFQIYDCGGVSRYRSQWPYYISKSDGVVFVIDRTDKERMGRMQEEIGEVFRLCQDLKIPILIFINKSDKETNLTSDDFIKITKVQDYNLEYGIEDCSASTGNGINEGKKWILQHVHPRNASDSMSESGEGNDGGEKP
ncbi:hypothetical protein M9Y10_028446 [Tritrichomonas musculus]|uniref:Uncharacterized protein n=1 Tax=Tritrichomonas musculus TaxID=1915356 RepID=A0ABR2KJD1_9EUKA